MRLDKSCSAQLQATRGPGLRKCRSSTPLYRHNSMAIRIWEAGEVTIKFQPGLTWGMDGPRNVFFLLHSTVTISDAPNHRINIFSLGSCPPFLTFPKFVQIFPKLGTSVSSFVLKIQEQLLKLKISTQFFKEAKKAAIPGLLNTEDSYSM